MPDRIFGTSKSLDTSTIENVATFIIYASSPKAVTYPENAQGIYLLHTGNLNDESQKNFEVLLQSISLRAMPCAMTEPKVTLDLKLMGAPTLKGEGFIWEFSVEDETAFFDNEENCVGLLIKELDGIVLPSGQVINTSGKQKNIEFVRAP